MSTIVWSIGAVALVLGVWHVIGYMASHVEQQAYRVITRMSGYEIRVYPSHLIAQTVVKGSPREALNAGFSIIARYIFGENITRSSIAMTAPVTQTPRSTTIAMTAPVTAEPQGDSQAIAFVMPHTYTLETLPMPTDSRIHIHEVPEQRMAALRFRGYTSTSRTDTMRKKLLALLARDQIHPVGSVSYAGFHAPWTPPWQVYHEVRVAIAD